MSSQKGVKKSLLKLLFLGMLALVSTFGAMRAEEIDALMRNMNATKIVHVLDDNRDHDDDPSQPSA